MKKKKVDYMPYISIIAIVAIVAVVLLVLNKGNLAGEASKLLSNGRYTIAPETPTRVTVVGTGPSTSCNNLKLITFNTIKDHYGGDVSFQFDKSATEICSDMGYNGCFAGQHTGQEMLFQSDDGTCRSLEAEDTMFRLYSCDFRGIMGSSSSCNTREIPLVEPVHGDHKFQRSLIDVICCS